MFGLDVHPCKLGMKAGSCVVEYLAMIGVRSSTSGHSDTIPNRVDDNRSIEANFVPTERDVIEFRQVIYFALSARS